MIGLKSALKKPFMDLKHQLDCTSQLTRASSTACRDAGAHTWHKRKAEYINEWHQQLTTLMTAQEKNRLEVYPDEALKGPSRPSWS